MKIDYIIFGVNPEKNYKFNSKVSFYPLGKRWDCDCLQLKKYGKEMNGECVHIKHAKRNLKDLSSNE